MGFSTKVIEFVDKKFGTGVTYWGYVIYRLFGGQIWNCLLNYALLVCRRSFAELHQTFEARYSLKNAGIYRIFKL